MSDLYLGFDLSTQQLKGIVVKSDLKLVYEAKVDFDADLSKYGIQKGVLTNPAEGRIYAPVAMWLEAVDLVLQRLKDAGLDFGKVRGVSGAGMQHGTVFWAGHAEDRLAALDPAKSLVEQLGGGDAEGRASAAFSHPFSPNWQDASTQRQCEMFDAHLGGPEKLAEVTGSSAHHRFSGPQIMRFRETHPDAYAVTSRISLVSSFLASVFLGRVAPIDISDVGGTNLWDIPAARWSDTLLALAAGGPSEAAALRARLGEDVARDGGASLGPVSAYMSARFGLPRDCQVIPFTGDNPSTILALPLRASDAIVSLGTSTTFLMSTDAYRPHQSYHFMAHPNTPGLYMFMLCYKNGGLAREHVRDAVNAAADKDAGASDADPWAAFNALATSTPPLGRASDSDPARIGLYFPRPEIVPNVRAGTWRFLHRAPTPTSSAAPALERLPASPPTESWPLPAADARAILESQFLSLRLRSRPLVHPQPPPPGSPAGAPPLPPQPRRVYLVGGGSANPAIAGLAGAVLGGSEGVFRLDIGGNACALGAAYSAVWGVERREGEAFEELVAGRWDEAGFVRRVDAGYREGVWEKYGEVLERFAEAEGVVVAEAGEGTKKEEQSEGK